MSARKRIRRFLQAPSIQPDSTTANELLHRRWENGGTSTYDLRLSDVRDLLRRLDASRAEVRTLTELYRKEQAKTREHLRTLMLLPNRAEWERTRAELADLHKQNQDKDRALDAAEAALTACRAANTQSLRERDEARAARRATDSYKESLEKALRATRAELNALRGVRTAENLRPKNGHWSTDYFVTVMEELVKELKK